MRLLERDDAGKIRLTEDLLNDNIPPYAILSHTWGREEVVFAELKDGSGESKAGYAKIKFCGDQAQLDGLKYFWVDTCCIDKSNNTELQEAINSMFRWYRHAAKCYVYLTDVSTRTPDDQSSWGPAFQGSRWFTRGWTLQELIAPKSIEFFSKESMRLGDRNTLEEHIHNVTGVPIETLRGGPLSNVSVSDRMAWIGKRNTTREEDKAYSLLGIFNVFMPLIYGEGEESAFRRLQEEISKPSKSKQTYDEVETRCLADLRSTDPREDKKRIEDSKGGLLRDTYRWVLDNAEFQQWRDGKDDRLLWIKGDPGKGKTMLLCGIIDELKNESTAGMPRQAKRGYEADEHSMGSGSRDDSDHPSPAKRLKLPTRDDHPSPNHPEPSGTATHRRLTQTLHHQDGHSTVASSERWSDSLLSYFFCQATDSRINHATAVLRGLIYLLILQQPTLVSHVRKKYDDAGKTLFEDTNTWFALSGIFRSILQDPSLKTTYLIIDALDECIGDLPRLLKFIVEMSSMFPRVKWIVSSRNWPDIEKGLNAATRKVRLCLESNEASVSEAVTAYVRFKVHRLAERNEYEPDAQDAVQSYLSENAHGTFLWVALVCHELADISGWEVEEVLTVFPPGLDALYTRMINQICTSRNSQLRKDILAAVSVVRRPITLDELPSLVDMPLRCSGSDKVLAEIVGLCGSFLTLRERVISFVHQSAKDFLVQNASQEIFPSGLQDTHHSIFSRSLRVMTSMLRRDIYSLRAPGYPINHVKQPKPDPIAAVRYACVYWVDHLHDWQSSDNAKHPDVFQDGGTIDNFLRQHYLHWLEALSLCRSMSQGILSMAKLERLLQQRTIASQLPSIIRDMRRFVLYCGWVVENYPLQVYASALVFSPARSITRGIFKHEERRWITAEPVVENDWNACTQTLEGHNGYISSVAFSPDSKLVASGSCDKTVKIWDAATGSCTQTLEGHSDSVNSVMFLPDSKLVASVSDDKSVKIWDAATGSCTQTLKGHSGPISSITFSPNLKLMASRSYMTVEIWDVAMGSCMQMLEGHSSLVYSVMFSPDSKLMASGSYDKTIKIWDVATGSCTQTLKGHNSSVNSIVFSPDLTLVASGSDNETMKIWDVATGSCTQTLVRYARSVTFSPDSKLVVSGSYKTIKIWDVATGLCTQTLEGHSDFISSVMFSPDSKLMASGSHDKTVKIWDVAMGSYTQTLEGHSDSVWSVTFSPDLKLMASGSEDKTVNIWDVATGSYMQMLKGHNGSVYSVTFSPDSKLVASGSEDQTIKIWDVATGSYMQMLKGHNGSIYSVTFSPDLKLVASGSDDKTIKIWDVAMGSCTQTLKGHNSDIYSIMFSPDSKLVVSGLDKETVKIWDVAMGSCTQTLEGHNGSIYSVAFSPDSKLMASRSDDETVKIWDMVTGSCTQTLKGHNGSIYSVAFSPDSKLVASRSYDKTIKIWDAVTGTCTQMLKGHSSDVAFLKLFTSWSGDAKIYQLYGISLDCRWITRGSENWLWLPPGCRPECSTTAASMVAIGCTSGRVLIMTFPIDN
ncbi:WD40-repeat-containing domain protein [Lasiosphaeria hispida]|uniref:WD40-repeat-containing domain protein n=1 Tax=Lasiosphaeria hispida TaxID=260671 RepID=A0AAJ0HW68_9PEZI|nr:WD40-repeat-containing domain protein [Lasiosphaeria hispida]